MTSISDSLAFARSGRVLEGALAVSGLGRLHDLLAMPASGLTEKLEYRLQGISGERGQPQLRLKVTGTLPLSCQRCLSPIRFRVAVDSLLELVPEAAALSQEELEDDSRDFLPAGALDVAVLVEDEVLLALPVAPRHEACRLPGNAEAGGRVSPFASLAGLKSTLN